MTLDSIRNSCDVWNPSLKTKFSRFGILEGVLVNFVIAGQLYGDNFGFEIIHGEVHIVDLDLSPHCKKSSHAMIVAFSFKL